MEFKGTDSPEPKENYIAGSVISFHRLMVLFAIGKKPTPFTVTKPNKIYTGASK